ncbi:MAG: DNA repair protein RecO [Bacteroidota bacterium]
MILTTEAVILRGRDYRDSSRIVTLYTKERGKLSAIAKGVRSRKSRIALRLEPMSYVTAVLYLKESRELQLLTQCDNVRPLGSLGVDISKMAAGMALVELVDLSTPAEQRNGQLFDLLVECLISVQDATNDPENALYFFEGKLLDNLGFRPSLHRCVSCGAPMNVGEGLPGKGEIRLSSTGVICTQCSLQQRGLFGVSRPALRVLQRIQEVSSPEPITRLRLSPGGKREVSSVFLRFLQAHIEGFRTLKSQEVFSSLDQEILKDQ